MREGRDIKKSRGEDRWRNLTFLLDLMLSTCRGVCSPMLRLPHSVRPIRTYVKPMQVSGRMYVSTISTTVCLRGREGTW